MSHRKLLCTATLVACGVAYATAPATQQPIQPTEHHQRVMKGVGTWEGTLSFYMPGAEEPMTSDCTETVTAIGDLWTTSRFETNFMGMPFTGSSTMGYDVKQDKYVGTWIDAMTTSITVMEGEFNATKNAIVMEYEMMDDMTGQMKQVRSYTTMGESTYAMKMYKVDGGEETLEMEIDMERKSGAREASMAK